MVVEEDAQRPMDGVGVVVIRVVRGEMVHDGTSHVFAILDDSLDVSHGLHGGCVFACVGRRDAPEDSVVVHREVAKRFGIVVLDAGADERIDLRNNGVDLRRLERLFGSGAQMLK